MPMRTAHPHQSGLRLLGILLIMLAPLAILLLPGLVAGRQHAGAMMIWLWATLFLISLFGWIMLSAAAPPAAPLAPPAPPRMLYPDEVPEPVVHVMDVRVAVEQGGVEVFEGPLREGPDQAYEELKQTFGDRTVPLLQEDERFGQAIVLLPKPVEQQVLEKRPNVMVNWLLFLATFLTTTYAGAAHVGVDLLRAPGKFTVGLPYSVGLLAILGIHELGHYFAAKYHGMRVTPPYFIPVPFGLGTFGAFIQMKSPPENRRALFDVAVAGPLAGLVIAIPAALIGLHQSAVLVQDPSLPTANIHGTSVGSSVLFALLAKTSLGDALQYGDHVLLSPLAFAGWLGLFITALNLLPIGQLDGGHIARAMFGTRIGSIVSTIAMWSLLLLAIFVWPGLMYWAIIVFFLMGRGSPPLNDVSTITPGRRALGYLAFLILLLMIAPLPQSLWPDLGIRSPYL